MYSYTVTCIIQSYSLSVCYYSKTSKSSGAEGNGMSYEEKLKLLQSIDEEEEGVANYIFIDSHLMTLDNVQNIIINVPISLPPPFSHPSLLSPPPFFLISPSLSILSPLFLSPSVPIVIADLDSTGVKRLLLSFEKQVLKNQEMRVKFPDQPEKFMDSEIELNAEIQQLHVISTVPFLYNILVESHTCQTLVGLLTHDNSDIAIAVVDLLQQLTDADLEGEEEEEGGEERMEQLIDALLAEKVSLAIIVILYSRRKFPWKNTFVIFVNWLAIMK